MTKSYTFCDEGSRFAKCTKVSCRSVAEFLSVVVIHHLFRFNFHKHNAAQLAIEKSGTLFQKLAIWSSYVTIPYVSYKGCPTKWSVSRLTLSRIPQ